jgi:hypothetical protein
VHDGKHWSKLNDDEVAGFAAGFATFSRMDFQEKQSRRLCPNAPTMVRVHVPDVPDVQAIRRGSCIPEVPDVP